MEIIKINCVTSVNKNLRKSKFKKKNKKKVIQKFLKKHLEKMKAEEVRRGKSSVAPRSTRAEVL